MKILSDIRRDAREKISKPGSYQWWYFDGISEDGDYQIVIIFYDGCPFSTRYIRQAEANPDDPLSRPENHPGISISLYFKGEPIFYSLTNYPPDSCRFDEMQPHVVIGGNSLRHSGRKVHGSNDFSSFDIRINECLPSGDELKGILTFIGMNPNTSLLKEVASPQISEKDSKTNKSKRKKSAWFRKKEPEITTSADMKKEQGMGSSEDSHQWNLVLPYARLECRMNLSYRGNIKKEVKFNGSAYHDHNVGNIPMKEHFFDWYWGRIHFPQATLVYYIMNKKEGQMPKAFLISRDNKRLLHTLDLSASRTKRTNRFFLRAARRLAFTSQELEIKVEHRHSVDSGPFYCRYLSIGKMYHPALGTETAEGIAEYIRPDRIHRRIFWPLVNMRLRYVDSKPHWVQNNSALYRKTW